MSNSEQLFHIGIKGLLRNKEGKYLCVKSHKGYFDLPGGRINQEEDQKATLARELLEELGVPPEKYTIQELHIPLWTNRFVNNTSEVRLFLILCHCNLLGDVNIILNEENTEYSWETARDLYEKVDILQTIKFENIFLQ